MNNNPSNNRHDLVQRLAEQVDGMRASATGLLPTAKKSKPVTVQQLPVAIKSKPPNSSQESLMGSIGIGKEGQNSIRMENQNSSRGGGQHSSRKGSQHPVEKETQHSSRKESQHFSRKETQYSSEEGSQHSVMTLSVKGSQSSLVKARRIQAPAKLASGLTEIEQQGNFF